MSTSIIGKNLTLERCPHCRIDNPNLQVHQEFTSHDHQGRTPRLWRTYTCVRCGGAVLVGAPQGHGLITHCYPSPPALEETIPARAKEYLSHAINSIHAPPGAVMLAASAVDAMLKEKNYKEGSLYARIKKAVDDHLITQEMGEWAHEVRLEANEQRHSDDAEPIPVAEDAVRSIEFTKALAQFLFVLPARVAAGRGKPASPAV